MALRSTKDLKEMVTGVRAQSKSNGIAGNTLTQTMLLKDTGKSLSFKDKSDHVLKKKYES